MTQPATTRRGKIICIGDLLVHVWWQVGMAARNIEHAAVALTSDPDACQIRAGGAGLFANTAALAGFDVKLFSVADSEPTTDRMLARLSKNVDTAHVQIIDKLRTPIKTRYINENGHILVRHDSETVDHPAHEYPKSGEWLDELNQAHCVVVSDYAKQCIAANADPRALRNSIVDTAHARSVPVFVDAKPKHLRDYAGADLFKLNRAELDGLVGNQLEFAAALRAAAAILQTKLLIVTDGSKGVGWWLRGEQGFFATPRKYSAGNCVGAGDTFFAGLLLGFSDLGIFDCRLLTVDQLLSALRIAAVAAGQRVRSNGAKPFNVPKILREARRDDPTEQKILPFARLRDRVAALRKTGSRIVFTNGCFDLLHAGHIDLLRFAKEQGDFLIVGVDSDDGVRALKGADRPIQNEKLRARTLAALPIIDAVCVFGDTMRLPLLHVIESVSPHVLVKGSDHADQEIVGAEFVRACNGRVAICPRQLASSTTALVAKLRT